MNNRNPERENRRLTQQPKISGIIFTETRVKFAHDDGDQRPMLDREAAPKFRIQSELFRNRHRVGQEPVSFAEAGVSGATSCQ